MKKIIASFLIVGLLLSLASCFKTPDQGLSGPVETSSEEGPNASGPSTTETDKTEGTTDGPVDETQPAGETTEAETTEEAQTGLDGGELQAVNRYLPEENRLPISGWLDEGARIYETACETFFRYMCTSAWLEIDYAAPAVNQIYYKVKNFSSLRDAEAEFLSVFTENGFGTALESRLIEKDGVLYAAVADRGADISYRGFDLTDVTDISDGYIEFAVRTHYDDGDDLSRFALRYERGAYRVDLFELPY